MKTYNNLLAMAWMAIRPFCTKVHADQINWEKVSHFFNFNTIVEAKKRTNLATNIQLLVEEQLKLPSSQNLWKAFQFWEDQHPELGFQFEFTLTSNLGAEVALKNLRNSFEGKEIFCFEILINKLFAEKLEANQLLNENILYRSCLIKLIDQDSPDIWEYHLREQKLPFFITLAHGFLHALNQLECVDWLIEKNEEFFDPKAKIQELLIQKLKLQDDADILKKQYKKLWKNKGFDDSLDEMSVILGKERQTEDFLSSFIGESTFLQEYYKDDSIISWSHYPFYSYVILENIESLLEKTYTKKVLKVFKNLKSKPQKLITRMFESIIAVVGQNYIYKNMKNIFQNGFFKL